VNITIPSERAGHGQESVQRSTFSLKDTQFRVSVVIHGGHGIEWVY
jgi:hypothetical protein